MEQSEIDKTNVNMRQQNRPPPVETHPQTVKHSNMEEFIEEDGGKFSPNKQHLHKNSDPEGLQINPVEMSSENHLNPNKLGPLSRLKGIKCDSDLRNKMKKGVLVVLAILVLISVGTLLVIYLNRGPEFSIKGRDTHTYFNSKETVERDYVQVSEADGFGNKKQSVDVTIVSNG